MAPLPATQTKLFNPCWPKMIFWFLFALCFTWEFVASSSYIPRSWNEGEAAICTENISNVSSAASQTLFSREVIMVHLSCFIRKTDLTHWKLMDLRNWTFINNINSHTSPSNRSVLYNISLSCEEDTNVSLPWPMRVPGLVQLRVRYCGIVDRFANYDDPLDSQIGDDMKILDIQHCFWIVNFSHEVIRTSGDGLNITSDYNCGQDSSLQIHMISNTSDVDLDSSDQENDISDIEADIKFFEYLDKIAHTFFKCNYSKLELFDESFMPVMPLNYFEVLVQNSDYRVLRTMNVSSTGIQSLPQELTEWRKYFPRLTFLDLTYNVISSVSVKNFPWKIPEVVTFDLRYNNFTVINMDTLKSWAQVDNFFVDIRNNPIHCGCELVDFLPYLRNSTTFTGRLKPYNYVREMECHTPLNLAGKQLYTLNESSLPCPDNQTFFVIFISSIISLFVVIALIILICYFRMSIQVLLFTRFHVKLPCNTKTRRNNAGIPSFDAYVSYSDSDCDWVRNNLLQPLENSIRQFRLCIRDRDFLPNKTIADNTVDSIQASRHTILVLSPSCINNGWSMEELNQAYYQSLEGKTRHLIVVLREKIPKTMMDEHTRRCCRTFPYLKVTDRFFLDKLVFYLTIEEKRVCSWRDWPCIPHKDVGVPIRRIFSDLYHSREESSFLTSTPCFWDLRAHQICHAAFDVLATKLN